MSADLAKVPTEELERYSKRGLLIARFLLVIAIINIVIYVLIAVNSGGWQLYILVGALVFYSFVLGIAHRWIKAGRLSAGAHAIIFGSIGVVLVAGFVIEGLGIILALALILMVGLFATLMLPQSATVGMVGLAFLAGIIIVAADALIPYERVSIPAIESFIPFLAATMAVFFAIFVIRNFKEYSLQVKLIIATLALAILAIVTVTVFVSVSTRSALTDQVGNNLNSLAETQALAIGEVLFRQLSLLENVGLNRSVISALRAKNGIYPEDPADVQTRIDNLSAQWEAADSTDWLVLNVVNSPTSEELRTFQEVFPGHNNLVLTDQYGAVVASSGVPEKYFYGDEERWQESFRDGFGIAYISEPIAQDGSGDHFVNIAVPIRDENEMGRVNTVGVLLAEYRLSALADILNEATIGETGFIELHFADNARGLNVIEDGSSIVHQLETVEEAERLILDALEGTGVSFTEGDFEGVDSLVSTARVNTLGHAPRVDSLGWDVVAVQPKEEALAIVDDQLQANLLLGLLIVVVAGGLAAFVARVLARPILQLTDTAVAVAGGDFTARATVESGDEIGTLALTFNEMTEQLQVAIEGLETRVEERTRALTASTEVSRSLSTILDPQKLVNEVVIQVQSAFNYYHVQIYLFDDLKENLLMAGGTGEAGQVMLARAHAIPAGKGLVGQAAAMNASVLIADVTQSEEWLPSPLLPDTQAEMTVPIALGDDVFGVLDVQHDVIGGLSNEDIDLLQAIASQVAVALQNARLYARTQEQAEREAVINAIGQEIQQATTMERVLQIAAQELGRSLDVERVTVQIHRDQLENGRNTEKEAS